MAPGQRTPHHPGVKLGARWEGEERTNSLRDAGLGGGPTGAGEGHVSVWDVLGLSGVTPPALPHVREPLPHTRAFGAIRSAITRPG